MKPLWVFIAFLLATSTIGAAGTHCDSRERAFFSCTVMGSEKVASLCGDADGTNEATWVQYRFGALRRPEMVYPREKKGSQEKFYAHFESHPEGGFREIWFRVGAYEYLIASDHSLETGEKVDNHIVVYKDGKPIGNLQCEGTAADDLDSLRARILEANEHGFFKAK